MWYDRLTVKLTGLRKRHSNEPKARISQAAGQDPVAAAGRARNRELLSISPSLGALHRQAGHSGSASSQTALTVTLNDRPSTSYYGQSVDLQAAVSGATTGTVEFFDGSTEIGTAVNLSTSGYANYVTDTLSVGTHSITAEYFSPRRHDGHQHLDRRPGNRQCGPHQDCCERSRQSARGRQQHHLYGHGQRCGLRAAGGQTNVPVGTVTFTVTNEAAGSTPITGTVTVAQRRGELHSLNCSDRRHL